MASEWFVYFLRCRDNSLYCGIAKDVHRRFLAHQKGKAARYTKAHGAVAIVMSEGPFTHGDALRRERALKGLDKAAKEMLIAERHLLR